MIEQAKGSAEGAEVAAIEAVAGDRGDEEGAEIGESHHHREHADQGCGPGIGWELGGYHHPHVPDEEKPLGMAQPPGPIAAQGEAAEGKTDCLAHSHTGAAEAADDAPPEEEDQYQCEKEGEGARCVQGGEHRLAPDVTGIRLEHRYQPGDQPPESGHHRHQNDQTFAGIGVLFSADTPEAKGKDNGIFGIAVEPDRALEKIEPGLIEPADEGQSEGGHGERHHPPAIAPRQGVLVCRAVGAGVVGQRGFLSADWIHG